MYTYTAVTADVAAGTDSITTQATNIENSQPVKTADDKVIYLYLISIILAVSIMGIVYFTKKRKA